MSANKTVAEQHAIIGNTGGKTATFKRTDHPGAAWFFEPVQLGLFIHYGISAVHGDLDISSIRQLPPGRKPVDTYAVDENIYDDVGNITKVVGKHIQVNKMSDNLLSRLKYGGASEDMLRRFM